MQFHALWFDLPTEYSTPNEDFSNVNAIWGIGQEIYTADYFVYLENPLILSEVFTLNTCENIYVCLSRTSLSWVMCYCQTWILRISSSVKQWKSVQKLQENVTETFNKLIQAYRSQVLSQQEDLRRHKTIPVAKKLWK